MKLLLNSINGGICQEDNIIGLLSDLSSTMPMFCHSEGVLTSIKTEFFCDFKVKNASLGITSLSCVILLFCKLDIWFIDKIQANYLNCCFLKR